MTIFQIDLQLGAGALRRRLPAMPGLIRHIDWFLVAILLLLAAIATSPLGWMSIAMAQFEKLTEQQREVSRLVLLACATRRAATILPDDLQQRCNGFTLDHVTDDVLRDGFSYLDRNRAEQHELMSSAPLSFIRLIAED